MKKSIITIWLALASALPAGAITTTETILDAVPQSKGKLADTNQYTLTAQGDVLVTYTHGGQHFVVLTYDAQTQRIQRKTLAKEQKLRFDFITVEDTAEGYAFIGFKYRGDPVIHYNVWDGSHWIYDITPYQTFACGELADFSIAATARSIVMSYSPTNCAEDLYQLREYHLYTQQWIELDTAQANRNFPLEVMESDGNVFVGQYGDTVATSFLYLWPEGEDRTYLEIVPPLTSSSNNPLLSLESLYWIGDIAIDQNGHVIMANDGQLYSWTNDQIKLIDLELDDGTTGIYSLTTLSDGRIFILAFGDQYQYILTWDGTKLSRPLRFNKNYRLSPGSTTPDVALQYTNKPYVVIKYNQPINRGVNGRIRFRAWDDGILRPAITFSRVMDHSAGFNIDGEADGRFGLITTQLDSKTRHRIWDNEQHRWVSSYKGSSRYADPQQLIDGSWQTLDLSLYRTKEKDRRYKLRLRTTRFD